MRHTVRTACGVRLPIPSGYLTHLETARLLPHCKLRSVSTRSLLRTHRANGPHRHRVRYIALPIVEYLLRRATWAQIHASVDTQAIDAALRTETLGARLFAMWAVERNALIAARLIDPNRNAHHVKTDVARTAYKLRAHARQVRQRRLAIIKLLRLDPPVRLRLNRTRRPPQRILNNSAHLER